MQEDTSDFLPKQYVDSFLSCTAVVGKTGKNRQERPRKRMNIH